MDCGIIPLLLCSFWSGKFQLLKNEIMCSRLCIQSGTELGQELRPSDSIINVLIFKLLSCVVGTKMNKINSLL